jgi:hypothetical protein
VSGARALTVSAWLAELDAGLAPLGLRSCGGFEPDPADGVPTLADGTPPGTVVIVGSAGAALWAAVQASPEARGPDPVDRWTVRVLSGLAEAALFPFDGPPHHPFQRWARRADPSLAVSPLGLLIHPELGLWHALRGALLYRARLDLPQLVPRPSPCEACAATPCLAACPVGAFAATGYDVGACRAYLRTLSGQPCMIGGCQARRACPVGRAHAYQGGLAQHLMRAFSRGPSPADDRAGSAAGDRQP